ncbi:nucleotidyltransferase domain-containing protein [Acidaminococcus fermentans]|uniref:nucleotidyltransferase domain-containing protein n=1 Tax=Acidaminococcus fermentans TaxID=905 RepID=UPI002431E2F5|nr:nucleotidyltransferase domain-containing protein [Acidaminococcus fermentans]
MPDSNGVGATRREARPGRIFDRFRDTLSWVKLFGSRARGDYKTTSDVDLAIASKTDILTPLQTALEDSQLPYTFDLEDGIERSQTGSSRLAMVRMLCQK